MALDSDFRHVTQLTGCDLTKLVTLEFQSIN